MVKLTSYTSSKVKGDLADLADLGSATDLARLAEDHETDSRVLIPRRLSVSTVRKTVVFHIDTKTIVLDMLIAVRLGHPSMPCKSSPTSASRLPVLYPDNQSSPMSVGSFSSNN